MISSGESLASPLDMSPSDEPSPKRSKYSYPINSMETMQRSVLNAFALKYSKQPTCTVPHMCNVVDCLINSFFVTQRWLLVALIYHTTTWRILGYRFMACQLVYHSIHHCSTLNHNYSKYWLTLRRLSS